MLSARLDLECLTEGTSYLQEVFCVFLSNRCSSFFYKWRNVYLKWMECRPKIIWVHLILSVWLILALIIELLQMTQIQTCSFIYIRMLINILEKISCPYFFVLSSILSPKVKNSGGMFFFEKIVFNKLSKCSYKTLKYENVIFLEVGFFVCACVVAGKKQCSILKCRRKRMSLKSMEKSRIIYNYSQFYIKAYN